MLTQKNNSLSGNKPGLSKFVVMGEYKTMASEDFMNCDEEDVRIQREPEPHIHVQHDVWGEAREATDIQVCFVRLIWIFFFWAIEILISLLIPGHSSTNHVISKGLFFM